MDRASVTAVLGPTNTGKTHLAVERLCAHSSGIMGFPLRLLAREVYDRVVRIKGPREVGLITGEEKILPDGARWLLCTAESMPLEREAAFVALDEAQLGADPERGHIFTDRLLNCRGREETMILGSEAIAPIVRGLVPEAEIIKRPRFSTLSYAGAKKLSRLPKRSAIVAFSAEEVYAVAEMLRRTRGGAAVVMGALSPRTRNAQVAMFQAGEVDYLVATDAIGMGLNMDVAHVAFASLRKFDGRRQRRLTIAEMAQIAGRAGRHQRDGTFGTLGGEDSPGAFTPEEIEAIEAHRFPKVEALYWRRGDPDFSTSAALIASLEERPSDPQLRAAPEAVDLAVLKRLADAPEVADRTRGPKAVRRLWEACSLPDFRKVGVEHHARLVARVYGHLSEGRIPDRWIAEEIARLDRVDGDVDAIGGRIAAARTWAYVAHRADWLSDPKHWAGVSEQLEEKLSDALHKKLTERFVDRRTSVLLREIGADPDLLDVEVSEDGQVSIEDEVLGRLEGFAFHVDPLARAGDRKRLLAAAERRLGKERARRATQLVEAPDNAFALSGQEVRWQDVPVARLRTGRALLSPKLVLAPALDTLQPRERSAVQARLDRWLADQLTRHLAPLAAMTLASQDPQTPPRVRALLAPLAAAGGTIGRQEVEAALAALEPDDRFRLRKAGLLIGTFDLFDPRLLKPAALRLLTALDAARLADEGEPPLPGATVHSRPALGFRRFGAQWVRIDVAEKIVRALHDARAQDGFSPDPALAVSTGMQPDSFAALLRASGFTKDASGAWRWRLKRARPERTKTPANHPFAALQALAGR